MMKNSIFTVSTQTKDSIETSSICYYNCSTCNMQLKKCKQLSKSTRLDRKSLGTIKFFCVVYISRFSRSFCDLLNFLSTFLSITVIRSQVCPSAVPVTNIPPPQNPSMLQGKVVLKTGITEIFSKVVWSSYFMIRQFPSPRQGIYSNHR